MSLSISKVIKYMPPKIQTLLLLPTNANPNTVEDTANGDIKHDCVEAFASEFLVLQIHEDGERADYDSENPKHTPG